MINPILTDLLLVRLRYLYASAVWPSKLPFEHPDIVGVKISEDTRMFWSVDAWIATEGWWAEMIITGEHRKR